MQLLSSTWVSMCLAACCSSSTTWSWMASLANFARGLADSLPTAQPQRDDATACQDNVPALVLPRAGVCTFSTTAATVLAGPVPEARWSPPVDYPGQQPVLLNRSTSLSVERPKPTQEVPTYNTQINDVLLLAQALPNGRQFSWIWKAHGKKFR